MSAPGRSSRRTFLKTAGALAASAAWPRQTQGLSDRSPLTFGVFTDSHYADREAAGTRHYRDSTGKLRECVDTLKTRGLSFCVALGDFYDSGTSLEQELSHIQRLLAVYRTFPGERHLVLGNHDLTRIDKSQYLREMGASKAHYSFDKGPYHFAVLDANYRSDFEPYARSNFQWTDTVVPPEEQRWLESDLKDTGRPTVVFVHQRLDADQDPHCVKNAPQVRKILEESGQVLAVFQGHDHRGGYMQINGIYYVTFRAMVEGPMESHNAFAAVSLGEERIDIEGFRHQPSLSLPVLS